MTWLAIAGSAVVTYVVRAFAFRVAMPAALPPRVARYLDALPAAIIAALAGPAVLESERPDRIQRDPRGALGGESVRAGRNAGKGETPGAHGQGEGKAVAVGVAQEPVLILLPAPPDGAHGMNDVTRPQAAGPRDDRLPRGAGADAGDDRPAFLEDPGAAGAMDGSVHAAAPEEPRVGGVDDGVRVLPGDVPLDQDEPRPADRDLGHAARVSRG